MRFKLPARTREIERRLSLRTKVSLSIFFSFLALIPVTGMSLFYLNGILEDVISITQVDARILEATRGIRENLDSAAGAEIAFVLFRDGAFLEQNRRAMTEIKRTRVEGIPHLGAEEAVFARLPDLVAQYDVALTRLADLYAEPAGAAAVLGEFEGGLARLQTRLRSLGDQAEKERDAAARRRLFQELRRTVDSLSEVLLENARQADPDRGRLLDEMARLRERIDVVAENLQGQALAHIDRHREHVISLSNRARRNILITLVLTGLVGVYLVVFLPARVVRSLRRITHVLQQAERGDLDVASLETGSDEVGNLAAHLNRVLRQLRTFDELKSERMLRAEQRLGVLVENLQTGVILVDDQMQPVFVSLRARRLLDARPEGADGARIAGLLQEDAFVTLLKEALSTQVRQEPRLLDLEVGLPEPRRMRVWADPVVDAAGEVREVLLLLHQMS